MVWATYQRQPLLTADREPLVYRMLGGKASELGVFIHALAQLPQFEG